MADKSPLTAEQVKENLQDFDDFDTELENLLEAEFGAVYQEALDAALVFVKKLEQLPDTVTASDRRVVKLLDQATAAFNKVWEKKAGKLLLNELQFAMRRGVVQMMSFDAMIEESADAENQPV